MSGLVIATSILSVLLLGSFVASLHLLRRLFEFDEVFQLLVHDVETNLKFFSKLLTTPTFSNSQEIITANNNMLIIAKRLSEYAVRMEELANKRLRTKEEPSSKPPVVR